jgi:hypothetical protein
MNAALRHRTDRSRGRVERKHQNISAVLEQSGLPWIRGYVPLLASIEARHPHFPAALDAFVPEPKPSLADERPDAFRLIRVYDFALRPRAFELAPPLQGHVVQRPINYSASFG